MNFRIIWVTPIRKSTGGYGMGRSEYLNVVRKLMQDLESQEMSHLHELGERLADRVISGQVLHLYDNGHMLNHELFNRAGGLALLARLDIGRPTVSNVVVRLESRPSTGEFGSTDQDMDLALARYAVEHSAMVSGDELILGSVSGRSPFIVELALEAGRRGIHTLALTARRYAQSLPPLHASGKLLYQVTEDVIDIQTDAGDAALAMDGLEEKLGPTSGVMAAVAMWTLESEVARALLAKGVIPTVFRSVNYPDGPERLMAARQRFAERGY